MLAKLRSEKGRPEKSRPIVVGRVRASPIFFGGSWQKRQDRDSAFQRRTSGKETDHPFLTTKAASTGGERRGKCLNYPSRVELRKGTSPDYDALLDDFAVQTRGRENSPFNLRTIARREHRYSIYIPLLGQG